MNRKANFDRLASQCHLEAWYCSCNPRLICVFFVQHVFYVRHFCWDEHKDVSNILKGRSKKTFHDGKDHQVRDFIAGVISNMYRSIRKGGFRAKAFWGSFLGDLTFVKHKNDQLNSGCHYSFQSRSEQVTELLNLPVEAKGFGWSTEAGWSVNPSGFQKHPAQGKMFKDGVLTQFADVCEYYSNLQMLLIVAICRC